MMGNVLLFLIRSGIIDLGAFCVELRSFFVRKRISVPMSYISFWEAIGDGDAIPADMPQGGDPPPATPPPPPGFFRKPGGQILDPLRGVPPVGGFLYVYVHI